MRKAAASNWKWYMRVRENEKNPILFTNTDDDEEFEQLRLEIERLM